MVDDSMDAFTKANTALATLRGSFEDDLSEQLTLEVWRTVMHKLKIHVDTCVMTNVGSRYVTDLIWKWWDTDGRVLEDDEW